MKTFNRSDVLSWQPCHGEIETLRIMEGLPNEMTALDVLRHEAAKPADRLWCVLRSEVLSDRTLRLFATWCARTALDAERTAGREPDPRSCAAVEIAERYALGQATDGELRDADDAAEAAARAAYDAARAAYDAACAAAHAAAHAADAAYAATGAAGLAAYAADAAYAAAGAAGAADAADAAYAAAGAATGAAARAAQVARLVELIEENER